MSIHRLEPAKQFVTRMILLNRFHAPDEENYDAASHALGAIHRGFPRTEVYEQSGYLVAAVAEAKPFAEANFRTGYDYVADLLAHEGYDLRASLKDQQDLGNSAWELLETTGVDAARAMLVEWYKPRILHVGQRRD